MITLLRILVTCPYILNALKVEDPKKEAILMSHTTATNYFVLQKTPLPNQNSTLCSKFCVRNINEKKVLQYEVTNEKMDRHRVVTIPL